jgi:hypothetical protein
MRLMRAIAVAGLLAFLQPAADAQDAQSATAASPAASIFPDDMAGSTLGLVASDKVRSRSKPSTSSSILTTLNAGTLVVVLSRSDSSENLGDGRFWWYGVRLPDGTLGWIYGEFLYLYENSPDSSSKPMLVSAGSRHYALVAFDRIVDPSPRNQLGEVDSMPVFVEQGARRALPIRIDQAAAKIRNPDGWYMIRSTLDEGSDFIIDAGFFRDGRVHLTVETRSDTRRADLQLTCVLRDDGDRPYFEVSSLQEGPAR